MLSRCASLPGIPPASTAADKSRHQVNRASPVDDEAYLSVLRADILRLHSLGTRRLALDNVVAEGPPLESMIRSAEKGAGGRGVAAAGLLEILLDKVMDAAIVGLKDTEGAEYKVPKHITEGRRCLSFVDPVIALFDRMRQLHCQACPVVRRGSLRSASKKHSPPEVAMRVGVTQTDEAKGPMVPPLSNGSFDAAGFFKGLPQGSNDQHGILLHNKHISATQALVAELSALKAQGNQTSCARAAPKEKLRAVPQSNSAPSAAPPRLVRAASTQTAAAPAAAVSVASSMTVAVQTDTSSPRSAQKERHRSSSKESSQQTENTPTKVRGTQTEAAISDQAKLLRVLRVEKKQPSEKPDMKSEAEAGTEAEKALKLKRLAEAEMKSDKAEPTVQVMQMNNDKGANIEKGAIIVDVPLSTENSTPCSNIPTPQAADDHCASAGNSGSGANGASRSRNERHGGVRSNPPLLRCPQNHGMQWIYRKELKVKLACLRCQCAINGMDGFHFCAICSHDTNERHSICSKCSSNEHVARSYCQQIVKSASDGSLTTAAAQRARCPNDWAMVSSHLPASSSMK